MRIRPPNDGERGRDQTVKKVSPNEVAIGDRRFRFDSVFDSKSKQVLQIKNCALKKSRFVMFFSFVNRES